jgi:exodeoxyribonuclease III
MKYISWNVNGIRAVITKGFGAFVAQENPDVLCVQETRALRDQVELPVNGDYHIYWNAATRRGYSGTAIFSKVEPKDVRYGIGQPAHDDEGRVTTAEYADHYLVNVYTPNSKRDLSRLQYRTEEWDVAFLRYLKRLEKNKPVVFCGDLNVAHHEIDLANPTSNRGYAGFTDEERATFSTLIQSGFIDTFREFTQDGGHYSWWSYFGKAREKNVGWRIDYFCISPALRPRLTSASILPDVAGSDHCPVVMEWT